MVSAIRARFPFDPSRDRRTRLAATYIAPVRPQAGNRTPGVSRFLGLYVSSKYVGPRLGTAQRGPMFRNCAALLLAPRRRAG